MAFVLDRFRSSSASSLIENRRSPSRRQGKNEIDVAELRGREPQSGRRYADDKRETGWG
jgi:hypothetical protein